MLVREQSELYWNQLTKRKRSPIKASTQKAYRTYLRNWILPEIGHLPIESVENGTLKALVARLAESGKSAATIAGVTNCVKGIVASANDQNGNQLYPRVWNSDFIDAPVISGQKAPIITVLEANRCISTTSGGYQALFALLAGTGLRIGEALALRGCPTPGHSYYDADRAVLVVNKTLYNGKEQSTKTAAGVREVDLSPDLNAFLMAKCQSRNESFLFQSEKKGPMRENSARKILEDLNVPPFHSFRRFRITHLAKQNTPRELIDFWAGHAGKDIHDRYVKIGSDIEARKTWADKAGLGFELP